MKPTLWGATRASVSGLFSAPLAFMAGSIAWSAPFVTILLLALEGPAAVVFLPALPVLGCGVLRLAAVDARGEMVRFRHLGTGIGHRFGAKFGLGVGQIMVLLAGALNMTITVTMEGLLAAVLLALAAYVLIMAWVAGVAIWPIVVDPRRDGERFGARVMLGVRVLFARPLQLGLIGLLAVGLLYAGVEWMVPLLFAPALLALIAAHYVLPAADLLSPLPDEE